MKINKQISFRSNTPESQYNELLQKQTPFFVKDVSNEVDEIVIKKQNKKLAMQNLGIFLAASTIPTGYFLYALSKAKKQFTDNASFKKAIFPDVLILFGALLFFATSLTENYFKEKAANKMPYKKKEIYKKQGFNVIN